MNRHGLSMEYTQEQADDRFEDPSICSHNQKIIIIKAYQCMLRTAHQTHLLFLQSLAWKSRETNQHLQNSQCALQKSNHPCLPAAVRSWSASTVRKRMKNLDVVVCIHSNRTWHIHTLTVYSWWWCLWEHKEKDFKIWNKGIKHLKVAM